MIEFKIEVDPFLRELRVHCAPGLATMANILYAQIDIGTVDGLIGQEAAVAALQLALVGLAEIGALSAAPGDHKARRLELAPALPELCGCDRETQPALAEVRAQ